MRSSANDRTWCFWEAGPGPFEAVVHHRWQHTYFHGENYSDLLDLRPYQYKMIRSSDYYQHIKQAIAAHPNVEWLSAEVQAMPRNGFRSAGGDFRRYVHRRLGV